MNITLACSNMTNEPALQAAESQRDAMREKVNELRSQADAIFVGRIVSLKENEATFEDIVNLKGEGVEGNIYTWTTPKLVEVGCGGLSEFSYVKITNDSYWTSYLIYVDGNTIIRAKEMEQFPSAPNPHEEIEWIKQ